MRRFVIVCDAVLFFVVPVMAVPWLIMAGKSPPEWQRPEGPGAEAADPCPHLPLAAALQALFLGLRGLFCVAVAPAIRGSSAHLFLLAASLAHQALATCALSGLVLAFGSADGAYPGRAAEGVLQLQMPPHCARMHDPAALCNGFAFVGVVYVFSLMFAVRATERWSLRA